MKKGNNSKRERLREGFFANLDQSIFEWLLTVCSRAVVVSALIFKTKVMEFSEKLNVKDFHASDGWLDRLKKRYIVSFKTVSCEVSACTSEMVALLEETMLPTILSKYKPNQIYNADKFGLFYWIQPKKDFPSQKWKCIVGNHSKWRLTELAAVNAIGENCQYLSLISPNYLDASNVWSTFPAGIEAKRRVGCMAYYLRNGVVKLSTIYEGATKHW